MIIRGGYRDRNGRLHDNAIFTHTKGSSFSSGYPESPQDRFLTEHLEWLLKIGCSFDKIVEWVRGKQQDMEGDPESAVPRHSSIDDDSHTDHFVPGYGCGSMLHDRAKCGTQQPSLSHPASSKYLVAIETEIKGNIYSI